MLSCSWVTVWQWGQRTECFLSRTLLIVRARHQNILKPWGLVDNTEGMCAGPRFYDTPPGTIPKIRLPDWLLCVWTRFSLWNFRLWSVSQHFIPADLFQLIEVWGLRARILCSIPTTMTHLSSEHPASTAGASLVYIPALSPDWNDICPRSILMPFVAWRQLTRAADPLGSKSVHLRAASFPLKPSTTLPNCFLSIHGTDQMSFTTVSDSTTNPLRLPNSSSHSPPPVNPAPSPPTRELPLLLLGLCDNNNNCVAVQRAFCWGSARPAGTGNPLSLFHHLQPILLCLGWRWSITGIKAAINVLSSRGHRHHSCTRSIFSLSASLPLPLNSESNSKKVLLARQIIPCSSKCLLVFSFFPPLCVSLCALHPTLLPHLLQVESQQKEVMAISVGGNTLREVHCDALQAD